MRTQHCEALTMNILNQVDTGGDGAGKGSVYSVSGPGECVWFDPCAVLARGWLDCGCVVLRGLNAKFPRPLLARSVPPTTTTIPHTPHTHTCLSPRVFFLFLM